MVLRENTHRRHMVEFLHFYLNISGSAFPRHIIVVWDVKVNKQNKNIKILKM